MHTPETHTARSRPAVRVTSVKVPSRLFLYRRVGAARRGPPDPRATRYEDIEPAVVVVVEERDPAAVGLEYVLLRVRVAVNDGRGKARLGGNVGELEGGVG